MLIDEIEKRIDELRPVIKQKNKDLMEVPEGSIHVAATANRVQYYRMNNGKRKYIKKSDHVLVQRLCQKDYDEQAPEFYTDRGERVRSKTEILIANALYKKGIPYRYEAPLKLAGYGVVHPDFTILNVRLRKEIYYEHMGMMDNEEYSEAALNKILAYEKNGFFPGKQLILTHETRKTSMNSRLLDKTIQEYFL